MLSTHQITRAEMKAKVCACTVSGAARRDLLLLLALFFKSIFSNILSERDSRRVSTNARKSAIFRLLVPDVLVPAVSSLTTCDADDPVWPEKIRNDTIDRTLSSLMESTHKQQQFIFKILIIKNLIDDYSSRRDLRDDRTRIAKEPLYFYSRSKETLRFWAPVANCCASAEGTWTAFPR